jgi:hypothetical protein
VEILDKDGKGTGVKATIKPLETWAVQEWQDFMGREGLKNNIESMGLIRKILDKHVKELAGIVVEDEKGERNATLSEMLDSAKTSHLGIYLMIQLFKESVLTETEAGN